MEYMTKSFTDVCQSTFSLHDKHMIAYACQYSFLCTYACNDAVGIVLGEFVCAISQKQSFILSSEIRLWADWGNEWASQLLKPIYTGTCLHNVYWLQPWLRRFPGCFCHTAILDFSQETTTTKFGASFVYYRSIPSCHCHLWHKFLLSGAWQIDLGGKRRRKNFRHREENDYFFFGRLSGRAFIISMVVAEYSRSFRWKICWYSYDWQPLGSAYLMMSIGRSLGSPASADHPMSSADWSGQKGKVPMGVLNYHATMRTCSIGK